MALGAFYDSSTPPSPAALRKALGRSARLWDQLVSGVAEAHYPITEQWNFGGAKFGWSLRLRRKDRTVLYLIPQEKGFLAGVVLGEKAVTAAHASGLPPLILTLLDATPRYAEGRGLRLPVATRRDVDSVLGLVAAKMSP
jgi:Protein of unknown function (DUF3788)